MVTYADLRDAHVAPLRYAAHAWTELARACADLEQRCGAELTGPLRASGWAGPAANAAMDRLDVLDDEFEWRACRPAPPPVCCAPLRRTSMICSGGWLLQRTLPAVWV
ncbi:hypothetical protein GCM10011608_29110 [Micromonospora sonchi]|uniref:Uncharacterized protein n=1 Tax=Micromonospora sonchi TaxID=1763543 RepID=A0A917TXA3_9ACTN|nr:hypothetical protein GCM10011608_29110 [Micromonospora sonchi]